MTEIANTEKNTDAWSNQERNLNPSTQEGLKLVWNKELEVFFERLRRIEWLLKKNLLLKWDSINQVSIPTKTEDPKYPSWIKQERYKITLPNVDESEPVLQWYIKIEKDQSFWKSILIWIWKNTQTRKETITINADDKNNTWAFDWRLLHISKWDSIEIEYISDTEIKQNLLQRVFLILEELENLPIKKAIKYNESAKDNLIRSFANF